MEHSHLIVDQPNVTEIYIYVSQESFINDKVQSSYG
jgi:hypothetical protein